MKPKRIVRRLQSLPLVLASLLAATTSMAVLSHYPGLVDVKLGVDGGRVLIDGRQPLTPIQNPMGHEQAQEIQTK
jgi:hypothetical protein